jgi:hypothetical protein
MVVTALLAGGAAGVSGVASAAVVDAYQGLKSLVLGRLNYAGMPEHDGNDLIVGAADRNAGQAKLTERLAAAGVDEPTIDAAQHLLDLLEQQKGKFVVDASQAKGVIIGDHGVQHNTFN